MESFPFMPKHRSIRRSWRLIEFSHNFSIPLGVILTQQIKKNKFIFIENWTFWIFFFFFECFVGDVYLVQYPTSRKASEGILLPITSSISSVTYMVKTQNIFFKLGVNIIIAKISIWICHHLQDQLFTFSGHPRNESSSSLLIQLLVSNTERLCRETIRFLMPWSNNSVASSWGRFNGSGKNI